jgi:O-antigen/teichoic acid export membrane protein
MVFYNVSWWIGNALLEFRIVLYQRLLFTVFSVSVVLFILLTRHQLQTDHIILAQFAGYALSSVCMFAFVRKLKISWKYIQQTHFRYFFDYGKFTSGSMIMGSLLRNADIFMIAAFLNQGAVAIYSAAQKTVEIFEVALRGMASHALPEFCKCANDFNLMMKKYVKASSMLLLGFMPLALLMSIFSEHIIKLLSGSAEYSGASTLLRIFMIYVLFLVVDRMTGIVLEAFGLARYNLAKTTLLVIVNVTGNAIALFCFHSLAGVAVVSIIAAVTGIISGMYFIMIHTGFSLSKQSIRNGFNYALR